MKVGLAAVAVRVGASLTRVKPTERVAETLALLPSVTVKVTVRVAPVGSLLLSAKVTAWANACTSASRTPDISEKVKVVLPVTDATVPVPICLVPL